MPMPFPYQIYRRNIGENGIAIMDPLAEGLAGLMICKVGYDFSRDGFWHLMDTALSEEQNKKIF
jgi:divalent metal cation (Fe/Co/Zn/Cd) transporter